MNDNTQPEAEETDAAVDDYIEALEAIRREGEIQLGLNDQSLRNHLTHTAQVIAGLGTLHTLQRSAEEDRELMEAIVGSPLPCPKP